MRYNAFLGRSMAALAALFTGPTFTGGAKLNAAQQLHMLFQPSTDMMSRGPRPQWRKGIVRTGKDYPFSSERQNARDSRKLGMLGYRWGSISGHFMAWASSYRGAPSGPGASETFGIRQQRRAWQRRAEKANASKIRKAARTLHGMTLKDRIKAREQRIITGTERVSFLSDIYGVGATGRLRKRHRDQLTGKTQRVFA